MDTVVKIPKPERCTEVVVAKIPPELLKRVKLVAKKSNVTVSEAVRFALQKLVAESQDKT